DTLEMQQTGYTEPALAETSPRSTRMIESVFVVRNNIAHLTEVKSGIQDGQYIQIVEGLHEDDKVITGPYRAVTTTLKDGDAVNQVKREELFGAN
ncbi:MAG TPA: hypothetical protein VLH16_04625, partial [Bacteroidales bacterium]|nr:hypothetical protein [Bacteroidales bacterium]